MILLVSEGEVISSFDLRLLVLDDCFSLRCEVATCCLLNFPDPVTFTLFDIIGKLIYIANEQQTAGKHVKIITFGNTTAGIYFLRADIKGVAHSFKLVKIN